VSADDRPASDDENAEARRRVAGEMAARLARTGVRLTGDETGEELVRTLEAVERFERAVQLAGGDLMVDEPIHGRSPNAPDNRAFVLPTRRADESPDTFAARVDDAARSASVVGRER
jgi:hypothetical protein